MVSRAEMRRWLWYDPGRVGSSRAAHLRAVTGPLGTPYTCRHCGGPISPDDLVPDGFRHPDRRGTGTGWLCPPPHMTLAQPVLESEPQPPPRPRPADTPTARRRPTPIPPLRERDDAPPEWPPAVGPTQWWEDR